MSRFERDMGLPDWRANARADIEGIQRPPTMAGSLRVYGSDGNQTAAGAMVEAGRMIVQMNGEAALGLIAPGVIGAAGGIALRVGGRVIASTAPRAMAIVRRVVSATRVPCPLAQRAVLPHVSTVAQSPLLQRANRQALESLRGLIDNYAERALLRAWDKGLSGSTAGNFADRYFAKALSQLNSRLAREGSMFRVAAQAGRDALGRVLPPGARPRNSRWLDGVLTNVNGNVVYSGWDIRFQSTPYPSWNSQATNRAYVRLFRIVEGVVREISVARRRD